VRGNIVLCIHHDDLDGHASAAIVARRFPYCDFIESDYRSFPLDLISKDSELIIVDYSPPVTLWNTLVEQCSKVIWIDHHESAFDDFRTLPQEIQNQIGGLQRVDACGAMLSWIYCFAGIGIPSSIRLIDAWDRHVYVEHVNQETVLNFMRGMDINGRFPRDPAWESIFSDDSHTLLEIESQGKIIGRKEQSDVSKLLDDGYEVKLDDAKCLAINCTMAGSRLMLYLNLKTFFSSFDVMLCWNFDGGKYTVHLYSEKIDVKIIAKNYGGGGHVEAAGFVCDKLPWETK
jgi:uncharacterized protein